MRSFNMAILSFSACPPSRRRTVNNLFANCLRYASTNTSLSRKYANICDAFFNAVSMEKVLGSTRADIPGERKKKKKKKKKKINGSQHYTLFGKKKYTHKHLSLSLSEKRKKTYFYSLTSSCLVKLTIK